MEKSILFIVPYPHNTAPSQRLKFEQYYPDFEKQGYKIYTAPFISDSFWKIIYTKKLYAWKAAYTISGYLKRFALLFRVNRYDVVYVHLWGTPFGLPIFEWLLRKLSKKLIYDIDDLIYKGDSSPGNKFIRFFKSSRKVDFLMCNADKVLISTDKLLSYAGRFTNKLSLIPATIDVEKYKFKKELNLDKIVIGWSGSHTTSKYLHLLDNVLKKISTRPDVKIVVMGDSEFSIDGVNVDLVEWSADTEMRNIQQFDIGLHPIPDEEWVYGKSGGKLVQYMAAGLPIVASAIGPNFKAIKDGYNGFLVSDEQAWYDKLELLITDANLRSQMGLNSKETAIESYSIEANFSKYMDAIS